MGDTLAGIIGAFCAQGIPLSESAKLGVYLHGVSGDLCAEELGEIGVTATGVATGIGNALQLSERRKNEKAP
jgi:NAD(P)H-hydrate epimerase